MSRHVLVEQGAGGRRLGAGETIGREGCDVALSDREVSRRHAVFHELASGPAIEDLGSTNGTYVNGRRIAGTRELSPGDEVSVGQSVWRVEAAATGSPPATAPRGDVPAPLPSAIARRPVIADAVPDAPAFTQGPVVRARGSAARRGEATIVCYAVVIVTALAVISYLAAR